MRNVFRSLAASLPLLLLAAPVHAQAGPPVTLTFDTIDALAGDVILASYLGYTFTNFSAYTTVPGFPGFNNGIVSPANAAYSNETGRIAAATPFDFVSASLGSGYYNNLSVTVSGFYGPTLRGRRTITVNTTAAQFFEFNFTSIDALLFTTGTGASTTDPYFCGAVGCSYFTLDNAVLAPSVVPPTEPTVAPEPSTLVLCALGLLVVYGFATRSASRVRFE